MKQEFVESLSKEVSDRLLKYGVKGKTITVKILKRKEYATQAAKNLGHGEVDSFSKSYTLSEYTSNPEIINKHVYSMLKSFQFSCADIRGLGLTITRLDNVQEVVSRKYLCYFYSF
jgi:DNA repair protein REV1